MKMKNGKWKVESLGAKPKNTISCFFQHKIYRYDILKPPTKLLRCKFKHKARKCKNFLALRYVI